MEVVFFVLAVIFILAFIFAVCALVYGCLNVEEGEEYGD